MTRTLSIEVGSIEVFEKLLSNKPAGAQITTKSGPAYRGLTCDSVEHLLQWTVDFAYNLEVNLIAAWLFSERLAAPS